MDNLKINISSLNDGQHTFEFTASPDEFNFDTDELELLKDVNIIAAIYKSGNQVTADIDIRGKFKLLCDRCLEDYIHDFSNKFEIIYKIDFKGTQDNDADVDIKFISPNTKFIELKNDIRDYILLSIPMKKAPPEKDGICEYCKKNIREILKINREEAVNPVWEKLLKSKTK